MIAISWHLCQSVLERIGTRWFTFSFRRPRTLKVVWPKMPSQYSSQNIPFLFRTTLLVIHQLVLCARTLHWHWKYLKQFLEMFAFEAFPIIESGYNHFTQVKGLWIINFCTFGGSKFVGIEMWQMRNEKMPYLRFCFKIFHILKTL